MSDEASIGWLALQCPGCRVRLRVKEAYAHLRGRCPECAYRIDAPRPQASPAVPSEPTYGDDFDSSGWFRWKRNGPNRRGWKAMSISPTATTR